MGGAIATPELCCLEDDKGCPLYTHNNTRAFISDQNKEHEAERKLVLATSIRSAQE